MIAALLIGRVAISLLLFGGAVWLLAHGYEHGWGWMLLIGYLSIPGYSRKSCDDDDENTTPPASGKPQE